MTNMDKLYESVAANGPVCVGLDTEISYLPTTDTAKTAGENVVDFNRALIAATKGVAGCYKVQIAYYESLGLDGTETFDIAGVTALNEGTTPSTLHVTATKEDGSTVEFDAVLRIDTPGEADYYRNGGILQYVLRQLATA